MSVYELNIPFIPSSIRFLPDSAPNPEEPVLELTDPKEICLLAMSPKTLPPEPLNEPALEPPTFCDTPRKILPDSVFPMEGLLVGVLRM